MVLSIVEVFRHFAESIQYIKSSPKLFGPSVTLRQLLPSAGVGGNLLLFFSLFFFFPWGTQLGTSLPNTTLCAEVVDSHVSIIADLWIAVSAESSM